MVGLCNFKTISHFSFNEVSFEELKPEWYMEDGSVALEDSIEQSFNDSAKDVCGRNVKVQKLKTNTYFRGNTDGVYMFRGKNGIFEHSMIQETKRKFGRNSVNYKRQILQSICYVCQRMNLNESKFLDDGCILNSNLYYDYFMLKDNIKIIMSLKDRILKLLKEPKMSPRAIADKYGDVWINLSDFYIYHNNIPLDEKCKPVFYNNVLQEIIRRNFSRLLII